MNDTLRGLIMLLVSNGITLGAAFGFQLSGDQVGAISAFGNTALLMVMYFWKSGQQASGTATEVSAEVTTKPVRSRRT